MGDKDLQDKLLELQEEVCRIFNNYIFIQLHYRISFLLNQQVFLSHIDFRVNTALVFFLLLLYHIRLFFYR
jgi:hypothetical protein